MRRNFLVQGTAPVPKREYNAISTVNFPILSRSPLPSLSLSISFYPAAFLSAEVVLTEKSLKVTIRASVMSKKDPLRWHEGHVRNLTNLYTTLARPAAISLYRVPPDGVKSVMCVRDSSYILC